MAQGGVNENQSPSARIIPLHNYGEPEWPFNRTHSVVSLQVPAGAGGDGGTPGAGTVYLCLGLTLRCCHEHTRERDDAANDEEAHVLKGHAIEFKVDDCSCRHRCEREGDIVHGHDLVVWKERHRLVPARKQTSAAPSRRPSIRFASEVRIQTSHLARCALGTPCSTWRPTQVSSGPDGRHNDCGQRQD
jgi:hypothetical protein